MKISCLYTTIQLYYPTLCNQKMCDTPSQVSKKCFWGNQLSLDTMKSIVILILRYFIKDHVLIHFGLCYQKHIDHDHKDGVKLHYPFYGIPNLPNG
jgi:hypothetical protein